MSPQVEVGAGRSPVEHPCISRPGRGPEMVVIAAGRFVMGSPGDEPDRLSAEGPRHGVAVQRPFALGRCEVTLAEFAAFVDDTGYVSDAERPAAGGSNPGCFGLDAAGDFDRHPELNWRRPGIRQGDDHPVVCVSWNDARAYAHWLSLRTGAQYRLPTEAEWEFATRAGTISAFWTGACIDTEHARYDGRSAYTGCEASTGDYLRRTVVAGSLPANAWGLHEVAGNAWEWVLDCWHESYAGARIDGEAWLESEGGECARRVVRGGGWNSIPGRLRSAARSRFTADEADNYVGFRLARTF